MFHDRCESGFYWESYWDCIIRTNCECFPLYFWSYLLVSSCHYANLAIKFLKATTGVSKRHISSCCKHLQNAKYCNHRTNRLRSCFRFIMSVRLQFPSKNSSPILYVWSNLSYDVGDEHPLGNQSLTDIINLKQLLVCFSERRQYCDSCTQSGKLWYKWLNYPAWFPYTWDRLVMNDTTLWPHGWGCTVNAWRTLINVDAVWAYSLDQWFCVMCFSWKIVLIEIDHHQWTLIIVGQGWSQSLDQWTNTEGQRTRSNYVTQH